MALEELKNKFVYDRNNKPTSTKCLSPDFTPGSHQCYFSLTTFEGPSAWQEAGRVLSSPTLAGLAPLKWSAGLAQACYDHLAESGPAGATGHQGLNGSNSQGRIAKYVDTTATGENLAYSDADTGSDVVLQLLVDDGVLNRGHRKNVLSSDFTHLGVS